MDAAIMNMSTNNNTKMNTKSTSSSMEAEKTPKISHHKTDAAARRGIRNAVSDSVAPPTRTIAPPSPQEKKRSHTNTTSNNNTKEKGIYELSIFLAAITTGTACSIISKVLYDLQGVGAYDGEELEYFDKPLIQTMAMFVGMIAGIPMHLVVDYCHVPFPGYEYRNDASHANNNNNETDTPVSFDETTGLVSTGAAAFNATALAYGANDEDDESIHSKESTAAVEVDTSSMMGSSALPMKTYFILALLSLFDLTATAFCMIGLMYLDVSIYQMLRGSSIIFVALLRQYGLKEHLYRFQWMGVLYNALSVALVGTAAMMDAGFDINDIDEGEKSRSGALIGILFMLAGTSVQALQYVMEEKMMVHDEVKVPPLLLFGMEGVWGFLFSIILLFPIGYYLPGNDHGRFEDHFNTFAMLWNTPILQLYIFLYVLAIFGYNLFAVLVTFSLSSIWHSILDNFRPMTVWITDLFIFYVIAGASGGFGEPWTIYSWIQLAAMLVLLYGTAVYNAPDAGSIRLKGQWYALGLDFQGEYSEIAAQRRFAIGSYPSLNRFISGSLRRTNSNFYRPGTGSLRSPESTMKPIREANKRNNSY